MAFKLFLEVLVLALYSSRHHAQADEIWGIMVLFLLLEVRIKQVPLEFMKKKKRNISLVKFSSWEAYIFTMT